MLALALGLASLTVGFGAVDLLSPCILHEGLQVSDVGYGTLTGVIVPVALVAQLGPAPWRAVGRLMLAAAALAYAIAGSLGGEWPLLAASAVVAAALAVVVALYPERRPFLRPRAASPSLLVLALVPAAPGIAYVVHLTLAQRHGVAPPDAHLGLQHWAALAAAALATIFLALLAGAVPAGFVLPGLTASVATLLWATTCLVYRRSAGAVGPTWATLAVGWAILFALAVARETRRQRSAKNSRIGTMLGGAS